MKTVVRLACCLILVSSIFALAQDKRVQNQDIEMDEHGAYSYETTDPFGNAVTVVVDPPAADPINNPWDDPDSHLFRGDEIEDELKFGKLAVTVNVNVVADEEYRAAHSNWQNLLYNIIETADNSYVRDFGIDWVIGGYYTWTSNGNSSSAILSDLATDGSGLPKGLTQGFTKDSKFTAGGIAYVYSSNPGKGYSVCLDQGSTSTTSALRHEIGHNYGCQHDFDPVVCLMNYTYSYSIDYFDTSHKNLIKGRTSWFR